MASAIVTSGVSAFMGAVAPVEPALAPSVFACATALVEPALALSALAVVAGVPRWTTGSDCAAFGATATAGTALVEPALSPLMGEGLAATAAVVKLEAAPVEPAPPVSAGVGALIASRPCVVLCRNPSA